ncbi:alkaline phosphatase D family protein [Fodinibius salsisoli]|uniref:Alkaline phosphatase D family protein n=1 Tax=Fodinibius salsisoli TaxID=2820877 RepID=A0ABT3PP95_9BACT|nr:alkaline phosphatase D family protein [Fodinibius salsisoli]MCW9707681.1 alkaline phosphatase D family protein [Fodinibius salsisoli]
MSNKNNDDGKKSSEHEQSREQGWLSESIDRKGFLKRTRRLGSFVIGGGIIGSLWPLACSNSKATNAPVPHTPSKTEGYPFQLGVASGDPLPDGVVLWTRLAPEPLTIGGGMESEPREVQWEIAEDDSFNNIVKSGTAIAKSQWAHSVHIEVEGLQPNREYYYRFKAGSEVSPVGRTKTTPAANEMVSQLNFAFASCQNYASGYYTAYDHMINEDLDVVFFLGDYIYEGDGQGHIGRGHIPKKTIHSLADFRIRHAQYKSDPSLQAAHAAFPWVVTMDDHEVKNNWAGINESADPQNEAAFQDLKARAFKAYYEHMPLRMPAKPGADIETQLYRRFIYGNLAQFNVLDTRQFRTDFACGTSHSANCAERLDPARTMLGDEQEQWLFNELQESSAVWDILPQQVFMGQMDRKEGPGESYSMDKWDGYTASRNRLFEAVKEHEVSNFVVLTGDIHRNFVSDLLEDFSDPQSPVLGTELVGTSISSAGDGADITASGKKYLAENPWIKFVNRQRGYVRCQVTPEQLKADFRVMPYVEKKGAPIKTRASFVVENGTPGAKRV